MARAFDSASSEYLEIDSCPVTSMPLTFGCWWYPTDQTVDSEVFWLGDKDAGAAYFAIGTRQDTGDADKFKARLRIRGASGHTYIWGAEIAANTWHHIAGRMTGSADQDLFCDGTKTDGGSGDDPTAAFDRTAIGRMGDVDPSNYSDGYVAEAAIWNVALTDDEMETLAAGFSPLFVRPQGLVAYWPLVRDTDDDVVGGYNMTAFNTPSIAAHPPQM